MRRLLIISITALMIVLQSCDSRVNIEEPRQFYKLIGKDGNQESVDLVTDAQDNIYILGKTSSTSDGDQLYVVKTNPKGEIEWEKIFGDAGQEVPKDIELTSNGDLVIVADRTDIATGEKDFVIYRVSGVDGVQIGTAKIGGSNGVADYVNSITETSDGFVVASYSDNGVYKDASLFRYDASLNKFPANAWNVKLQQLQASGGYDLIPVKVVQVNPNLFYTFCYTNSIFLGDNFNDYNFFIYISNQLNDGVNTLVLPGPAANSDERLTSVSAVPAEAGSGFVLAGYISTQGSNQQELYLVRVRQDLANVAPSDINSILLGSPKTITENLSSRVTTTASVFPSKNSGFLVLGNKNSTGNEDIFLTKVDNTLNNAWTDPDIARSFGGAGNDWAGAVAETSDGRILLCGTMVLGDVVGQSKVVLINLSANGMFGE